MNKIYRVASATLAMVLLLLTMGSCSKESQLIPEDQLQAGAGQLAFTLDNDALRSVPAEGFEKEVDNQNVWCVFLSPATTGGTQTFKAAVPATLSASGKYTVNAGFEGSAQMFVIANVQDDLKGQLTSLNTSATLDDVQKLVVKNTLGDNTTDPHKFIMTSEIMSVTLPAVGTTPASISEPIKLNRLAARFDVISEVPGLTLTSVSVLNRIITSTLCDVNETGTKAAAATEYTVADGKQLLHKIYSYQNTNKGGTTDATSFTISGNYNNQSITPIKVDLKDAQQKGFDVKRNYCYRILIKPAGDDGKPINPDPNNPTDPNVAWKVTIKVIDWNEAAADLANYSDEDLEALGTVTVDPTINLNGKNLLEAVAEYNIDITGTKFATTHSNKAGNSGYFTWPEAKALTMPAGYHLPTNNEWYSIMAGSWNPPYIYFNKDQVMTDYSLTVQIPGQTGTMVCKQDIKQVSAESATYMIRYKDNDTYRSAWSYSYVDSPIAGEGKILKIESVPVKAGLTIDQLNRDYFANLKVSKYVKTIYLPATGEGYNQNGSQPMGSGNSRGYRGYYWSSSVFPNSNSVHHMCFGEDFGAGVATTDHRHDYGGSVKWERYTVRPFQGI